MYLVKFPDNIKCPSTFWALFVKILLYLWYFLLFYICRFEHVCWSLFVDMCMSIHSCAYMLRCICPLKDLVNN